MRKFISRLLSLLLLLNSAKPRVTVYLGTTFSEMISAKLRKNRVKNSGNVYFKLFMGGDESESANIEIHIVFGDELITRLSKNPISDREAHCSILREAQHRKLQHPEKFGESRTFCCDSE